MRRLFTISTRCQERLFVSTLILFRVALRGLASVYNTVSNKIYYIKFNYKKGLF